MSPRVKSARRRNELYFWERRSPPSLKSRSMMHQERPGGGGERFSGTNPSINSKLNFFAPSTAIIQTHITGTLALCHSSRNLGHICTPTLPIYHGFGFLHHHHQYLSVGMKVKILKSFCVACDDFGIHSTRTKQALRGIHLRISGKHSVDFC